MKSSNEDISDIQPKERKSFSKLPSTVKKQPDQERVKVTTSLNFKLGDLIQGDAGPEPWSQAQDVQQSSFSKVHMIDMAIKQPASGGFGTKKHSR